MTTTKALAAQLADERDVPLTEMFEIVRAYADQFDDEYDCETGELTDAGAQVIIEQMAAAAFTIVPSMLDEIAAAQALVDAAEDNLLARDTSIRAALSEGVPVREIVAHTGLSRERVYQIRDGRRK